MNLYISDLHFGHRNSLLFDNRPFRDTDSMDYALIQFWNSRVQPDDDVYILGDFCYRSGREPQWYLQRLKGHKHLIIGNHDGKLLENEAALRYFVDEPKDIVMIQDTLDGESRRVVLCHYPMAEWNGMYYGVLHVYGHIHARDNEAQRFMAAKENAFNAGAPIIGYTPASLSELRRHNEDFRKKLGI